MTGKFRTQLGDEVVQASALHDYPWPDEDPELVDQRVAVWGRPHSALLDEAVGGFGFDMERFGKETRGLGVGERVWRLLSARAFNFNGVERVRGERLWRERIGRAVERGEAVEIAYPLLCRIENPAKRMTPVTMTAGELAMVRSFRALAGLVKTIHAPGLRVHVLSDATLYNGALFVPMPSAYAYVLDFTALVEQEGAAEVVRVHDYAAMLAPFHREFAERHGRHYRELAAAPARVETLGSLPTSVRTNVNTRRLGLGFAEMKALFGPRQTIYTPLRGELDQQARFALMEQLAVKMACAGMDVPSRLWPDCVRASCHKGLKNGRAVLGLRCYPEYYASSLLLPYHGMPLIEEKKGAARLVIAPEISLRGERDLLRVVNEAGDPVLYVRVGGGGNTRLPTRADSAR